MTTDVSKIASATGIEKEKIQIVKGFIFNEKHSLSDGRFDYFDPDFMMAQSWQRLIEGNPEKHDITLIHHELMEKELMDKGFPQSEAHSITSKKYNYGKEAEEYYAKLKEHKNR